MVKPSQAWPHFHKPLGLITGGFLLYGLFQPKNSIDRPLQIAPRTFTCREDRAVIKKG